MSEPVCLCRGVQGPQGVQGPAGPQGIKGETGDQGIQGVQGVQGPQGIHGQHGDMGPQGPQGIAGVAGPSGPQGLPGNDGLQGPAGPQGIQGDVGAQGPIGPAGPQGVQGDVGAQGPIGPAGPQGVQGDVGAQGPIGPAGPQGVQGIQGPAGDSVVLLSTFGYINPIATSESSTTTSPPWPASGLVTPGSSGQWVSAANRGVEEWAQFDMGVRVLAVSMYCTFANGREGTNPKIQVSNDGNTWATAHTLNSANFTAPNAQNFRTYKADFNLSDTYRYLRLQSDSTVYCHYSYLQFFGKAE